MVYNCNLYLVNEKKVPADADGALARAAVERGVPFASVADHDAALTALLALDEPARARGTVVVAGCGLAPGLADEAAAAAHGAVRTLLAARQATATVSLVRKNLLLETSRKLRRVECRLGAGP